MIVIASLQGGIVMHLTYGYGLKENDDILIQARRTGEIMSQVMLPGAALVNHIPMRAVPLSFSAFIRVSHDYGQYGASLHGSPCSSMSHWPVNAGNWDRG